MQSSPNGLSCGIACTDSQILSVGHTCGALARADRGAFLIEAKTYYRAFRQALRQAERSVTLLAWDLHSEILLEREEDDGYPRELGAFLNTVLEEKPALQIYVLVWDFSVLYAAEREWKAFSKWFRQPHERLHFRRDSKLPLAASHHQKVVVVDQTLAFAGGIDLSAWRWDDPAHRAEDERRTDPKGKPYEPYHDVQLAVTGPAARQLARLCAERWKRATGEPLPDLGPPPAEPPWPDGVPVDFRDLEIGFAHTYAPYEPYPGVHEIEELHLRIIAQARHYLYLEYQYLSSARLVGAIEESLRAPEGPEVVLVLTQDTHGWVEESTMGLLRDRLLERLEAADAHGRFRPCFPEVTEGGTTVQVYVHAKVIIADDRIVKVGSSNLSNRSMRMDSEVDLVIARDEPFAEARRFLHRLLAIHFHRALHEVEAEAERAPDLRGLLDALDTGGGHRLVPLHGRCDNEVQRRLADSELLDPKEPIDPAYWIRQVVPGSSRRDTLRHLLWISVLIAAGLALVALVGWGWGQVIDRETAVALLENIRGSAWAPVVLVVTFLAASLVGISLNVLLVAAAIVLGPWMAFGAGFVGSMLGANLAFLGGRRWGTPLLRRFGSERVEELSQTLANRGVLAVALLRLVPIAPFPVINLAAGSSPLGLRVFNLGSILGMAPGMLAVVLLADRTLAMVEDPSGWSIGLFLGVALVLAGAIWFIRRTLKRRAREEG